MLEQILNRTPVTDVRAVPLVARLMRIIVFAALAIRSQETHRGVLRGSAVASAKHRGRFLYLADPVRLEHLYAAECIPRHAGDVQRPEKRRSRFEQQIANVLGKAFLRLLLGSFIREARAIRIEQDRVLIAGLGFDIRPRATRILTRSSQSAEFRGSTCSLCSRNRHSRSERSKGFCFPSSLTSIAMWQTILPVARLKSIRFVIEGRQRDRLSAVPTLRHLRLQQRNT